MMCSCAPLLLSRDFLRLMQLLSTPEGHHYIEQILTSLPPSIEYGKMPSCEAERWVFTLAETIWVVLGRKPHRYIQQTGDQIGLSPAGKQLTLRLAGLHATGRGFGQLAAHP